MVGSDHPAMPSPDDIHASDYNIFIYQRHLTTGACHEVLP